jgi:galactose mutarotase-like enzyme
MNYKTIVFALTIALGAFTVLKSNAQKIADIVIVDTIQNNHLKVTVNRLGAQLTSLQLKNDNTEYLWQGDTITWRDHAILQFPIIGNVDSNQYRLGGKVYKMMSHGFARLSNFKISKQAGDFIEYQLEGNDETRKMYPFDFVFTVKYQLEKQVLKVFFTVKNTGNHEMYFTLGYHPGFNCPLLPGKEKFTDYYLKFDKKETLYRTYLEKNLLTDRKEIVLNSTDTLRINKKLFSNDALVFEQIKSRSISLRSDSSKKSVTVTIADAPYLGIWSPAKDGNFVCIEPWYGLADFKNNIVDFKNKAGMKKLNLNQIFSTKFEIQIQ